MLARHKMVTTLSILCKLTIWQVTTLQVYGNVFLSPNLVLHDVLFIPYFKFNLLSVNKLYATANLKFTFHTGYCIMQDQKTETLLAKGNVLGSLYILDNSFYANSGVCNDFNCSVSLGNVNKDSACNMLLRNVHDDTSCKNNTGKSNCNYVNIVKSHYSESNFMQVKIWHKRLAHAPYIILQHINLPKITAKLTDAERGELQICDICHKAKQVRQPFPTRNSCSATNFELVHLDV